MKQPTNQVQLCLFLLLNKEQTPLTFIKNGLMSYHQRIGDIRNLGINVKTEMVKFKNRFGHLSEYAKWTIGNKKAAEKLYEKLNK